MTIRRRPRGTIAPTVTPALDPSAILLRLHQGPEPLVMPNAWDAASARVFAAAGFPAIATSSGAIARTLGFEDGEQAPVDEMAGAAGRIVATVAVPVTVDFEAGYGFGPVELTRRLQEIGAAGCNLEDSDHGAGGLVPIDKQVARLAAIRAAVSASARGLVINARVDVFLPGAGVVRQRLAESIRRANAYLSAGADCVFPIGLSEEQAIERFVQEVHGPVNILAHRGGPSIARLSALGVRRITFGSQLHRLTEEHLADIARQIRTGTDPFDAARHRTPQQGLVRPPPG